MTPHDASATVLGPPDPPDPAACPGQAGPTPRRRRPKAVLKVVLSIVGALALAAGGIAYWALDRFVIDHVEITDVSAYEAAARSGAGAATTVAAAPATTGAGAATTAAPAAAVTPATTASSVAPAAAAAVTGSTYTSDTATIAISKVSTGSGRAQVTYFVADVVLTDATQLRAGFADNQFGRNIVQDTSTIAEAYDAVFAINGDYYGFRTSGIVIRNGVLYRDDGARTGLAIYADGTMSLYDETATTGAELLAAGVWNTLSFGPALVADGQVVEGIADVEVDTNVGNHSIQGNQPRTGLGLVDTNHFVFVVVDGRSAGYSRGVTMTEFAEIFRSLGATVAYNLDGGGSSTMVFDGAVVNNPLGKGNERGTSDILYIA